MAGNLNCRALSFIRLQLVPHLKQLRVTHQHDETSAELFNFSDGNPLTGLLLAQISMAGNGLADIIADRGFRHGEPAVVVSTTQPIDALMRSQIAAYQLRTDDSYCAYVSGPGRTCFGNRDKYIEALGGAEANPERAIFVIEGERPTTMAIQKLATRAKVSPSQLVLCWAPSRATASMYQVLARICETGLKRLYELHHPEFDIREVESVWGLVAICPKAKTDGQAIALANEASIRGGKVVIKVRRGNDKALKHMADLAVSSASRHYSKPFAQIMASAMVGGVFDFSLVEDVFAPAQITIVNGDSRKEHHAGRIDEVQLARAFRS